MTKEFKHISNPLHVYCRVRELGVPKWVACWIIKVYESVFFNRFVIQR